ncbi:hypothetical protein [Candidatus Amarolinea dominans]|uniref:hypothetical protein n=1 Tax=Candidatus Amarolinea dominans TaxID=3140696 RepID=UPI003137492D|nr:hypothetical protein [Anaerolineae bacterium]
MGIERMLSSGTFVLVLAVLVIVLALATPALTVSLGVTGWHSGIVYADDEPTPTPTPQGPGEGACINGTCGGG